MASYFDEHDCEPLANGEAPNHLLHLARAELTIKDNNDIIVANPERRKYSIKITWETDVIRKKLRKHFVERLLLDTGAAMEWNIEYDRVFGGSRKVPPASKKFVDELPTKLISPTIAAQCLKCSVCLGELDEEDETKTLPCEHQFHSKCILPWLQKVSTCPVCRYELPTDDPDYEMYKKHKARAKQREYELETLHNSMFG